jgi:MFS family permease
MQETTRPEPSRTFRWLVLVFVSLTMFGNYYVYDCIAPIADVLAKQLGFSDSNIGLMQAIYSVPNVFMVLIGGYIVDRLGARKAILLFGSVCLVGAIVTSYPDNQATQRTVVGLVNAFVPGLRFLGRVRLFGHGLFPQWLASLSGIQTARSAVVASMASGRLIFGLGAESLIVAVSTAIAKWFRGKELSFAFGINLMIARFGSWLAQNSPTWAGSAYSNWRSPLLISVGFGTFCVTGAVVYWVMEAHSERSHQVGQAGSTDKVVFRDIYKFSLSYWYVVALCIVFYSAIFPFETFAIKFFIEAHGTSRELGGFLVSILTAFTMFGTPAFGLFVDKLGKRALLMMMGSMLLIPVYLMMAYTRISLYVPMAMMGVAFSLIPAVMWPSVAYLVDQSKLGTAYGLMTMIQNIGLAGFNLLVGWANDHSHAGADNPGGYHLGMWIFSTLGFLGVIFAFLLHERETGPHGHGLETITTASGTA